MLLVDIHFFCLMPNHYHLLLSPLIEGGIPKFMNKLNMGYAKYFNIKYERVGTLFQGRYKSVSIEKSNHFDYLPFYIHFNPLDLKMPEWREGKVRNVKQALDFLGSYRWSSHLDYTGKRNFPEIIKQNEFLKIFEEQGGYEKALRSWLDYVSDEDFGKISLE
jgi:putative transposase